MEYVNRNIESKFTELSNFFRVMLLTGARQVGKTTMLRHLAGGTGRSYASLDDPLILDLAQKDPVAFFQSFPPPVLIDEVQYAPELFPVIKLMADKDDTPGQFWLTGSQQYQAMARVRESLAGRVGILRMYGMTQNEKAGIPFEPLRLDFDFVKQRADARRGIWSAERVPEHVWLGGMPALQTASNVSSAVRDAFFASYIDTYIVRDVAKLGSVHDLGRFRTFLQACAALVGQQVNYSKLTDAAGVSQPTARRWLDLLEGMNVIHLLPAFSANALKRLAKTPKLYFADTGLAAWLTRWPTPDTLWMGASGGAFFENAVVSELMAILNAAPDSYSLSYFRDSNKTEIDVMVEVNGKLHPLEIKQGSMPRRQEMRKFEVFDRIGVKRGPGGVICSAPEPVPIDTADAYIPAWTL